MNPASRLRHYLRDQQTPAIYALHGLIAAMLVLQLLLSNLIDIDHNGQLSENVWFFYGSWGHFLNGMALTFIAILLATTALKQRGMAHFYPYLQGNWQGIRDDLNTLRARQLPTARPGGLAAAVQGLGLAALLLTALAGLVWFAFWRLHWPGAGILAEVHETCTSLLIAYMVGHGSMGLLHALQSDPQP